jgi:hypothetical protein
MVLTRRTSRRLEQIGVDPTQVDTPQEAAAVIEEVEHHAHVAADAPGDMGFTACITSYCHGTTFVVVWLALSALAHVHGMIPYLKAAELADADFTAWWKEGYAIYGLYDYRYVSANVLISCGEYCPQWWWVTFSLMNSDELLSNLSLSNS